MVTSAARPPLHFQNSILPPLARMSGWNTDYNNKTKTAMEWLYGDFGNECLPSENNVIINSLSLCASAGMKYNYSCV